jgi:hypothetical protein
MLDLALVLLEQPGRSHARRSKWDLRPPGVSAPRDLAPEIVVRVHCIGWRAQHRLGTEPPDAFIPNAVGTSVTLVAA